MVLTGAASAAQLFSIRIALGVLGIVGIYMSFHVLVEILMEREKAMVSFQLHPNQTVHDFQILLVAQGFLLGGFIMYFAGGLTGNQLLLNGGRMTTLLFLFTLAAILFRWRRRFEA